MKILQIINSLTAGGAEKLLVNAVIKYREQGLKVDILLLRSGDSPFLEILSEYNDIKIYSLGEENNVYSIKNIWKIKKYIKHYDVVHVHLFPSLYWVAIADMLTSSKKKYKLVFTEHNTTNRRRSSKILTFFDKLLYHRYDNIISISDSVDLSLKEHLGKGFGNISKIYNGIDLEEINLALAYSRKDINFNDNQKLILQVSSFTPQKNQLTLIKSLKHLPDYFTLILVGDGPLRSECEKATKELDLADRVLFLGIRNDVPKLLKTVDVIVLSSHYEGLSLSSVEALASGKPFVASDVPGLTEVVEGAGLLFEDNDEKTLANHIIELSTNAVFYKKTVDDCLERSKKFNIKTMAANYISLFKSKPKLL
ncbi:glycosyltransferase [Algibacter mikhailovii]|uniref:Glycosyl transferase n=1 Tax=Algibacter mikhailovii TaxID=425498 RepID=A0A918V5H3_9FLAO|nr:glycosyltransferase [Algibacter mikhailovii]GGZ70422.1 glycosyl transferase [Algibacter mikhailovii]